MRASYEKIAEAIQRALIDAAGAERTLEETSADPSPRVQEARDDTAARLKGYGVNDAIEEGVRRYNELTGAAEEDTADD